MADARHKCALIMAGGTGGHIFPGLALAEALRKQDWQVHWLGAPDSMESRLVPAHDLPFEPVRFGGVRGKGLATVVKLPFALVRALLQSWAIVRKIRPDVLVGLGGYITVPGGLAGVLARKPLLLHEQNSVAGSANKLLARFARRVFTTFPGVLSNARQVQCIGNPLRQDFLTQPDPATRFAARQGPLRLLVVGGSLGAQALNRLLPQALALMPLEQRPVVRHQSGQKQFDELQANYQQAAVEAELLPFIDDMASALAEADLVICRAGASTVSEIAAIGAASLFVPFPHAIDDHQTANARYLVDHDAAWLMPQKDLTAEALAAFIHGLSRPDLLQKARQAYALRKLDASEQLLAACEEALP